MSFCRLGIDHELPEVAVWIPEVHARCRSTCAGDVARRADVIDSAIPQVLLRFVNRAVPYEAEIGISRQRNVGKVELVIGPDILRFILRSQYVLFVDVDFLVLTNFDGYLSL